MFSYNITKAVPKVGKTVNIFDLIDEDDEDKKKKSNGKKDKVEINPEIEVENKKK